VGNQLHPITQTLFQNSDAVFQDGRGPIHTAGTLQLWFEEHKVELQHLLWPAQSPNFDIIQPLGSVLETRVRNRFPPPTNLNRLQDVLKKEWYKILLETIQNLYEPIPRISAVLKAKSGPAPY
jgi:hypothetical protein